MTISNDFPSRRLLRRVEPGIDAAFEAGKRFQAARG
jgi:hypothetical protein